MTLSGIPRTSKHSGSDSGIVSVVINTPNGGIEPKALYTDIHGCRRGARRKRAEHPCLAPAHVGDSIRQARTLLVIEETPIIRQIREGPLEDAVDKRRKGCSLIGKKRYRLSGGVDVDWTRVFRGAQARRC